LFPLIVKLSVLLDKFYWPGVMVLPDNMIVNQREANDKTKKQTAPVHTLYSGVRRGREEEEYEG
jgi:hypothetical protein